MFDNIEENKKDQSEQDNFGGFDEQYEDLVDNNQASSSKIQSSVAISKDMIGGFNNV